MRPFITPLIAGAGALMVLAFILIQATLPLLAETVVKNDSSAKGGVFRGDQCPSGPMTDFINLLGAGDSRNGSFLERSLFDAFAEKMPDVATFPPIQVASIMDPISQANALPEVSFYNFAGVDAGINRIWLYCDTSKREILASFEKPVMMPTYDVRFSEYQDRPTPSDVFPTPTVSPTDRVTSRYADLDFVGLADPLGLFGGDRSVDASEAITFDLTLDPLIYGSLWERPITFRCAFPPPSADQSFGLHNLCTEIGLTQAAIDLQRPERNPKR